MLLFLGKTMLTFDRKPGLIYYGTGDREVAAQAVVEACNSAQMVVTEDRRLPDGSREISAKQTRSPWQILLNGLPQITTWRIFSGDDPKELRVYSDFSWFPWFRHLFYSLWVLFILGPTAIIGALTLDLPLLNALENWLIVGTSLILLAMMFISNVAEPTDFRQRVFDRVKEEEGFLEPIGSGVSRRTLRTLGSMLGVALVFSAPILYRMFSKDIAGRPIVFVGFLGLLLLSALTLCVAAWLMLRQRRFGLRVTPLVTGLATAVSAIFALTPAVMFWGTTQNIDVQTIEHSIQILIRANSTAGETDSQFKLSASLLATAKEQQAASWIMLLMLGIPWLMASVGFWRFGVIQSLAASRVLKGYSDHRNRGEFRAAFSGESFFYRFRILFFILWIQWTILIFCGLATLGLLATRILGMSTSNWQPVEILAALIRLSLGGYPGASTTEAVVSMAGLVYAAAGWSLIIVSVGQLALNEKTMLKHLCRETSNPSLRQIELQHQARRWMGDEDDRVYVVFSNRAAATEIFDGWRCWRFIELPKELDRLQPRLSLALLAHEVGHLSLGHCRKYRYLRWLGRIGLVGDGFMLTLQDSWHNEKNTDRLAVEKLGISSRTMISALRNLGELRNRRGLLAEGSKLGAQSRISKERLEKLLSDGSSRWRRSFELFYWQYFEAMDLHYWYAPKKERFATFDQLAVDSSRQAESTNEVEVEKSGYVL